MGCGPNNRVHRWFVRAGPDTMPDPSLKMILALSPYPMGVISYENRSILKVTLPIRAWRAPRIYRLRFVETAACPVLPAPDAVALETRRNPAVDEPP